MFTKIFGHSFTFIQDVRFQNYNIMLSSDAIGLAEAYFIGKYHNKKLI